MEAVLALSFSKLLQPTFNQLQLIAMFVFGQASNCGDTVATDLWEAKLTDLAVLLLDPK